ncbi:MAG: 2-hydroxychromene-2-carboxylate isomerase [Alphaproteobacteria bacterium]
MATLEFWYEFASTYSYLAAGRINAVAAEARVPVVWKPFLLGPIFASQGLTDSPFNVFPVKGAYMWRDMERYCIRYGLPLRRPSVFPRNGLLAARVALVGVDEGWCPDFTPAVYRANFGEDQDVSDPAVIGLILSGLGLDADRILEAAVAQPNKDRLRAQSEEALSRGIFGAPTFFIGSEMFWGNERLEDALDMARLL